MGTCNFYSMKNFSLWTVSDSDFYFKRCPECYCNIEEDTNTCSECGENLQNVEPEFDELAAQSFYIDLEYQLRRENEKLQFHTLSIRSGYYEGLQLFVSLTSDAQSAGFTENGPEYVENDDTRYYFDMCRSAAIRKYQAEQRKVEKALERIGRANGMEKLAVYARFSNGETWYTKIS